MSDFNFKVGDRVHAPRSPGVIYGITASGEKYFLGRILGSSETVEHTLVKEHPWVAAPPPRRNVTLAVEWRPAVAGERYFFNENFQRSGLVSRGDGCPPTERSVWVIVDVEVAP